MLHLYYFKRTNFPYLSGDSFAKSTDFIVSEKEIKKGLNLKKLSRANSIFVVSHIFEEFLSKYGEFVTAKTLITGNSDFNFNKSYRLPNSITLWLCQNNGMSENLIITTLPIGLQNLSYARSGRKKFHKPQDHFEITNRVLVPPMSLTNPIRMKIIDEALRRSDLFDVRIEYLPEKHYFELTRRYRFIFVCEGSGFENHRIWECLYQNTFPILIKSSWSISLEKLRLPILLIDSLDQLTLDVLSEFERKNYSFDSRNTEILWMPFWQRSISSGLFDL